MRKGTSASVSFAVTYFSFQGSRKRSRSIKETYAKLFLFYFLLDYLCFYLYVQAPAGLYCVSPFEDLVYYRTLITLLQLDLISDESVFQTIFS